MGSKWGWMLRQFTRMLWVRAALFAVLGVVSVFVSLWSQAWIPWELPGSIGSDAVDSILTILASSMLTVTTFSLNVMVSAYASTTSNVTPRATKLLMQDSTTQNVLATFIGSFLFSLVGLVALSTGTFNETGRLVLFIVTIFVIVIIVVTLLRWIEHLSQLGRVGETTDRVERATTQAITERVKTPYLGGRPLVDPDEEIPKTALPVYADVIGYVQYIDMNCLAALTDENKCQIFVTSLPGTLVDFSRPLAWIEQCSSEQSLQAIRSAFSIKQERSFDQDPRFGLAVLAEIASRALSPAVNDPGTAIDVIGRSVRLLSLWDQLGIPENQNETKYPRIWVCSLQMEDLFDDLFTPLARDSASLVEVQMRLQKAFLTLSWLRDQRFAENARRHSELALKRAEIALVLEEDKTLLRELAGRVRQVQPSL